MTDIQDHHDNNKPLADADPSLPPNEGVPEENARPLTPKTEEQLVGFEDLNVELNEVEHEDVVDVEGKKTADAIKAGIFKPRPTFDTRSFAFIVIDIKGKQIEELYDLLADYTHVREIDMSNNRIKDVSSVSHLPHLTHLNASKNIIESIDFLEAEEKLQFLFHADFSNNLIMEMPSLALKRLKKINFQGNRISSCERLNGHPSLEILELRDNKLKNMDGINDMPELTEIYAAKNDLSDISGLRNLPSLTKLHLRDNKSFEVMSQLDDLPKLKYINLRETGFKDLPSLSQLASIISLEKLSFIGTPLEGEVSDLKTEVLMIINHLKLLGKDTEEITQEEREAAIEALKQRRIEEEEKRREEEERRKQEEEEERIRLEEEERKRIEEEAAAAVDKDQDQDKGDD